MSGATTIEKFFIRHEDGSTTHFEDDADLGVIVDRGAESCKKQGHYGNAEAGQVLIELGVDGGETNVVHVDGRRGTWAALEDASNALAAVMEQLAALEGSGEEAGRG